MGHVRQLDDSRSYSAMRQLCSDLRQFAIQVRQLGYSCSTAEWRERECLDLCECMLVAVKDAEARIAVAKAALRADTRC